MTVLRLSALVIVLVTAIGLYKKAWLPEKHCIRAGFFVYYTHLSNLLILLYELALGASGHDPHCGAFRWLSSPGVALSMTLCIYVTHLIYAFVLLPTAHRRDDESWLKGRFSFGNVCVHFITPGLTVLQWLLWQDKAGLTVGHAVWCCRWRILPLPCCGPGPASLSDAPANCTPIRFWTIPGWGRGGSGCTPQPS